MRPFKGRLAISRELTTPSTLDEVWSINEPESVTMTGSTLAAATCYGAGPLLQALAARRTEAGTGLGTPTRGPTAIPGAGRQEGAIMRDEPAGWPRRRRIDAMGALMSAITLAALIGAAWMRCGWSSREATAVAVGRPARNRTFSRWWLRLTAALGLAGVGFHAYGVHRNMGGWRNWRQNILSGPPLPAPPSFAGLALAGLAALSLIEERPDA